MRVLILAGGRGTRLSEETSSKPKPMVELGGDPILWHLFKIFAAGPIKDVSVLLGYRGDVIRQYISNLATHGADGLFDSKTGHYEKFQNGRFAELNGLQISTLETGEDSLTGQRIKLAVQHFPDDEFLVTYGDGLANVDLHELLSFHKSHGKLATVTAVRPVARFGHLKFNASGQVSKFEEKNQTSDGWINGGFFILNRGILEFITDNEPFEGKPLEKLSNAGELVAFQHHGFWRPMDTLNDKNQLEKLIESGLMPWLEK
jgi:glucose-1-phosphate cytidylyltransferase